jgi:chorismate dehydratase
VASVILVSRTPWEALDGARVVLGSDSRTGVALAQVLLSERVGVTPSVFVRGTGDVADVLRSADAYVLIGDQALRHVRADSRSDLPDGPTTFTYDLAGEWRAWTGLPATFAVWAASARFAREQPEALARARQVLGRAREYAAASSAQVADAATARTDPPIVDLAGYFAGLIYRSNESVVAGANALLAKLGLPAVRPVADL